MTYESRVPEVVRVVIAIIVGACTGFALASHYQFHLFATCLSVALCAVICWVVVSPVPVFQAFQAATKSLQPKPLPSNWQDLMKIYVKLQLISLLQYFILSCIVLTVIVTTITLITVTTGGKLSPGWPLGIIKLICCVGLLLTLSFWFRSLFDRLDNEGLQKEVDEGWSSIQTVIKCVTLYLLPGIVFFCLWIIKAVTLIIGMVLATCHSNARLTAMVHGVVGMLLMISTGKPWLGLTIGIVTGVVTYEYLMKRWHQPMLAFSKQHVWSAPFKL